MIDVIIPVYDGLEETKRCLNSVFASIACNPEFDIVVVNDCSPNKEIHRYLQELALDKKIKLLVNTENKGFVATVNSAMRLNVDRDVVILNSDTEVANNWLERILHHAQIDSKIATITPFSNNAEICSFPVYCKSNELPLNKTVKEIDNEFSKLPIHHIDVPTGVGFCMFIRRQALNDVGYFDEDAFGRGYGEENDFCQRALKKGWRNVTCVNVFVFHEGGVSFSSEKMQRVENAMRILDKRHPNYHLDVHQHIQADPERVYRNIVQLSLLAQDERPKIMAISHGLGGGVVKHVVETGEYLKSEIIQFVLRPIDGQYFELSYKNDGFDISLFFARAAVKNDLCAFIDKLGISAFHWHHTLGYSMEEIELLLARPKLHRATVHDYYWVGANPTLTDVSGVFVEDASKRDQACLAAYPLPEGIELKQWREFYNSFLQQMDLVLCPSRIAKSIMLEYYPEVTFTVAPHSDWEECHPFVSPKRVVLSNNEKFRVLVIGALSREKGADLLERAASYRDSQGRLEYHLLGYAYRPLAEEIICHGAYKDFDLEEKIKEINPHLVWFPAQWHETYCYVLTTVLKIGLPILATDLGAIHERLANRPLSFIHSWKASGKECNDTILQIRDWLQQTVNVDEPWLQVEDFDFRYQRDYVSNIESLTMTPVFDFENMRRLVYPSIAHRVIASGKRERLLRMLWKARQLPVLRSIARVVPFSLQRKVKRVLSVKPIHEIIE